METFLSYATSEPQVCCARGSGDKLVTRKKEKESNKLVAEKETFWSHSSREGSIGALILKE